MTYLIVSVIIVFLITITWLAARPDKCPKCGERMSAYDAKKDVCINPDCRAESDPCRSHYFGQFPHDDPCERCGATTKEPTE